MTQAEHTDETGLSFHARLYAIMRWERRCAQADLRQVARFGDRWLREELRRVASTAPGSVARPRGHQRPSRMQPRGGY